MSYGRSSQVISLIGTGILINIGRLRGKPRAAVAGRVGEGRMEAGETKSPKRRSS
jgi:hypothetical protein